MRLVAAAMIICFPGLAWAIDAFPGAEGFGRTSAGGRGGAVIRVTNLNDAGAGSLRACATATGPRTCVFTVGGTIILNSIITVTQPRLTIAGQTAPGGGIQLKIAPTQTKPLFRIQAADVVIRHVRFRRGATSLAAAPGGTCCGDSLSAISGTNRLILDHVSFGFGTDENVDLYQSQNVTIQNSIIAYGLRFSTDSDTVASPGQHHSMGVIIGDGANNLSLIDNLLAFNLNRNPRIQSGLNEVCGNTVYGAQANPITISGGTANVIGNSFDRRPLNNWNSVITASGSGRAYAAGNLFPAGGTIGTAAQATPYVTPSCIGRVPVALTGIGAFPRDSLDAATIVRVETGAGALIDDPAAVGGWPVLATDAPYLDADADGMADDWEVANGFSPTDALDGNSDPDGDGFTGLDRFLQQRSLDVAGVIPPPPPPVCL